MSPTKFNFDGSQPNFRRIGRYRHHLHKLDLRNGRNLPPCYYDFCKFESVLLRNDFHFSEVYQSVNYIGSLTKII